MKSWTKKGIGLLLILMLALTTACGGNGGQAGSGTTEPAKTEPAKTEPAKNEPKQSAPEPEKPLKLSVQIEAWGTPPKDGPVQDEIEKRTNTDLKVDWISYKDYESRFNIQLSSGDLPDITATVRPAGQLFSSQVIKAINAGVFHDLTPYIEASDFKTKYPNLAEYDQKVWDAIKFNGKIYAMPRYTDPITGNSGIVIRKDLLDKANLPEPKTVEELGDTLIKLSQQFGIYGLETPSKDLDRPNYKPLAVAFTGVNDWAVDKEGNFQYQAFMPEYKGFLLWMKNLYDNKAIDPEFALQQGGSKFSEGKSAAKIANWWGWAEGTEKTTFDKAFKEANPDAYPLGLLPLKGPKAHTVTINPFNRPALISSKVKKEDIPRVLALFDYAASP
jgi:putative aldouronate transport system substrate-binding protein